MKYNQVPYTEPAEERLLSEDQGLSLLKRRIFLDRGLDCEQYKENYLKRRFAVRLRATGARDYLDYLRILKSNPDEYTTLMNELTINVTQFFRDADVYAKLRDSVFPDLIKAKSAMGSRTLRIWSAGCASGEEPYSLAILIEKALGDEALTWNVRVLGSDFDEKSLARARQGVYQDLEMLDGVDAERYFEISEKYETKVFRVKDEIKRRVRFEKINLLAEGESRHFDMVLCRNVLIYFGRQVQNKIIVTLASTILRDGYLVLGKSETLGADVTTMFKPAFARERIYQLTGDQRAEGHRADASRTPGYRTDSHRTVAAGAGAHTETDHTKTPSPLKEPSERAEIRRVKSDLTALRERNAARSPGSAGGLPVKGDMSAEEAGEPAGASEPRRSGRYPRESRFTAPERRVDGGTGGRETGTGDTGVDRQP